jgi:3-dehydroquinate synthase
MSDLVGSVTETKNGFHVDGYERISYDFTFLDGVFNPENRQLAECYKSWGRVLAVTDLNVYNVYGEQIEKYFQHHGLELKVHKTKIGEKAKTIPTFLSIVDSMTEFGIYRKVLAIHFISSVLASTTLFTDVCRNRFWSLGVAL